MASTDYQFKVDMPCEGCVNAIKRSLGKTYGDELSSVDADLPTQLVKISIIAKGDKAYTYDQVYEALAKTGKTVTRLN